jgi:hypothetical protein
MLSGLGCRAGRESYLGVGEQQGRGLADVAVVVEESLTLGASERPA